MEHFLNYSPNLQFTTYFKSDFFFSFGTYNRYVLRKIKTFEGRSKNNDTETKNPYIMLSVVS